MKKIIAITLLSISLLWITFLITLPTFDFDESLYRRVAEEMRLHHDFWHPTFDLGPLWHKPPIFYWIIWAISTLIDRTNEAGAFSISAISARIPSLLSTLGIIITLYFSAEYITRIKLKPFQKWIAPVLFMGTLFPALTATAVIFDPLQTFLMLPAILIPARYFYSKANQDLADSVLSKKGWVLWIMSLFLATALKGLNGIALPLFAVALHLLISVRQLSLKSVLQFGSQVFLKAFLPAAILSYFYFLFLDHEMGRGFTQEFFWVHHFGRGTQAMESHAGGIWYYAVVLFLGGGFLSSYLIHQAQSKKITYSQQSFLLSFVLAFFILFSISATKLPHYSWPAWPALALMGFIYSVAPEKDVTTSSFIKKIFTLFALLPIFTLATLLLIVLLHPAPLIEPFLHQTESIAIYRSFHGLNISSMIYLGLGYLICMILIINRSFLFKSPLLIGMLGALSSAALGLGLAPTVKAIALDPVMQVTSLLREKYLKPGDCFRFTGSRSPTIALIIGNGFRHNQCWPEDPDYLIAPEWKLGECEQLHLPIIEKREYIYLCGKPYSEGKSKPWAQ